MVKKQKLKPQNSKPQHSKPQYSKPQSLKHRVATTVLDAGARYGLHPSWKPFTGELCYLLFEPDQEEAKRLRVKYRARKDEIVVEAKGLLDRNGKATIAIFRNRAMSSMCDRLPVSPFFAGERKSQVEILRKVDVPVITIDSYAAKQQLKIDFLKLDTEGTEDLVLAGAREQLAAHVLGVRCEVNFDRVFDGGPTFAEIHQTMLENGFYLLNLGYDGRGEYRNEFVPATGKFGVLTDTDAVWLVRFEELFRRARKLGPAVLMKYAAFCLLNDAPDVAIEVLQRGRTDLRMRYAPLSSTRLHRFLDIALHQHFYRLKWQPGQSLRAHAKAFEEIFGYRMKESSEYNQSLELNPD